MATAPWGPRILYRLKLSWPPNGRKQFPSGCLLGFLKQAFTLREERHFSNASRGHVFHTFPKSLHFFSLLFAWKPTDHNNSQSCYQEREALDVLWCTMLQPSVDPPASEILLHRIKSESWDPYTCFFYQFPSPLPRWIWRAVWCECQWLKSYK